MVYKEKVKLPLQRDGVTSVPDVSYEQVANHFRLHCAHAKLQRAEKVKMLAGMREKIGERLLRFDEDGTGGGEIDKTSVDLWLKVAAVESRERQLLFPAAAGRRPPAAPGQPAPED